MLSSYLAPRSLLGQWLNIMRVATNVSCANDFHGWIIPEQAFGDKEVIPRFWSLVVYLWFVEFDSVGDSQHLRPHFGQVPSFDTSSNGWEWHGHSSWWLRCPESRSLGHLAAQSSLRKSLASQQLRVTWLRHLLITQPWFSQTRLESDWKRWDKSYHDMPSKWLT